MEEVRADSEETGFEDAGRFEDAGALELVLLDAALLLEDKKSFPLIPWGTNFGKVLLFFWLNSQGSSCSS